MSDEEIIQRWKQNHEPWTIAVREGRIRSRVLATDAAIVAAIIKRAPRKVLDIGCGEGWLVRRLAEHGVDALGVDVVPELIGNARIGNSGRYQLLSHEELAANGHPETFDLCVSNFSLLGDAATSNLVESVPKMLNTGGALIVQTLHPWVSCGQKHYCDGWRPGSWQGIDAAFAEPSPWFFRTLQSWVHLFSKAGLRLEEILEPSNPDTCEPASIILVGIKSA